MEDSPYKDKKNSAKEIGISDLFFTFFKIGSFTFGGGYAMIPLVKREIVDKKNWIDADYFLDNLAVAQSLPGSNIISFSLLVGYRLKGIKGGIFSLLGTILPSFLIILLVAVFLWQYQKNELVQAAFCGIRPAVVALIISAAYELGKGVFRQRRSLLLFILFFGVLVIFRIHPLLVIVGGAITGFLWTNKNQEADP
jgi:chromate transporter